MLRGKRYIIKEQTRVSRLSPTITRLTLHVITLTKTLNVSKTKKARKPRQTEADCRKATARDNILQILLGKTGVDQLDKTFYRISLVGTVGKNLYRSAADNTEGKNAEE